MDRVSYDVFNYGCLGLANWIVAAVAMGNQTCERAASND